LTKQLGKRRVAQTKGVMGRKNSVCSLLGHETMEALAQKSKTVSYVLFFVLPVAVISYWRLFCDPKGGVSRVPIVVMIGVVFAWQVFTLCHHRQFLSWILAILYGMAFCISIVA
jgi:hypothetical protein